MITFFALMLCLVCVHIYWVNRTVRKYVASLHEESIDQWNELLASARRLDALEYAVNSDRNNQLELWARVDKLTGENRYGQPLKKDV